MLGKPADEVFVDDKMEELNNFANVRPIPTLASRSFPINRV